MTTIDERDPRIVAVVEAIHDGDIVRLRTSLAEHPELISCQIGGTDEDGEDCGMRRSLMHVVTDWPGHFPNGAETVRVLAAAGVDVNGRFVGGHTETPALGGEQRRHRRARCARRRRCGHRSHGCGHRRRHAHQ